MTYKYINKQNQSTILFVDKDQDALIYLKNKGTFFYILWNHSEETLSIQLDGQNFNLEKNTILFLTYNQHIDNFKKASQARILLFNREFFCVHTQDEEVSCNGLLFFGSAIYPKLKLNNDEVKRFVTLSNVLKEEFLIYDQNREEMLRILLKRLLIRSTRIARNQLPIVENNNKQLDLIRRFNVLVEEYFKTKKTVKEYAELLYKSPKTLANIFSKNQNITPLQLIHNRILIEAKRYLIYTSKSIQ